MKSDHHAPNAAVEAASPKVPAAHSPVLQTAGLMLLTVAALTLSYAPIKQFYLAWIGLVPFFLAVRSLRSPAAAFFWGWAGGIAFFLANTWWLQNVTMGGAAALIVYLGLFWATAAVLIRGCALLGRFDRATRLAVPPRRPLRCALLVAALWCGLEWVRGNFSPFGAHGFPLLYLGHSQTPMLVACQIADITGAYGVSFWVVLVNAVIAMLWIDRRNPWRLRYAYPGVVVSMVLVTGYGLLRMHQQIAQPGPTVLVVQSNFPQSNSGEKGASADELIDFHVRTTESALADCAERGRHVDLVVWSETMMPPLNSAARTYWRGTDYGNFLEQTSQRISGLADRYRTSFLVGGTFQGDWQWVAPPGGEATPQALDRRNSAYFYGPTGLLSPERYDKIQLLPFGEFVPYRDWFPRLYRMLVSLGPADIKSYELNAGAPDALTVFHLDRVSIPDAATSEPVVATEAWRFVVPICFEDIVSPLVHNLMWGADGKRADLIVNITNDGWFRGSERALHLQAAIFRCIENRVPVARCVNTGISGFIDSTGRLSDLAAAGTQGTSVKQLQLDDRTTIYGKVGDAFAELCAAVGFGIVLYGLWLAITNRREDAASRAR
jgi:apolipoprotein N-acyltransferase